MLPWPFAAGLICSLSCDVAKALDVQANVTYNDTTSSGDHSSWGRMADVSKPFAVLQALVDPLVGWRTIGTNNPQALADSGSVGKAIQMSNSI